MSASSSTGTNIAESNASGEPHSFNCRRIKELGYIAGKHLNLYGEHFQMISDPFTEGEGVAVRVTSGNNPMVRTIRLPVLILVGMSDLRP